MLFAFLNNIIKNKYIHFIPFNTQNEHYYTFRQKLTKREDPITNTLSHSATKLKTESTLGFGTLSPKKTTSGFNKPPHVSQDGTCYNNILKIEQK